jgi:hypothetical protein
MELYDGFCWKEKLSKAGGSFTLVITKDILKYLELEPNEEGDIFVTCKADKGKHGKFLGFGKPSEK